TTRTVHVPFYASQLVEEDLVLRIQVDYAFVTQISEGPEGFSPLILESFVVSGLFAACEWGDGQILLPHTVENTRSKADYVDYHLQLVWKVAIERVFEPPDRDHGVFL